MKADALRLPALSRLAKQRLLAVGDVIRFGDGFAEGPPCFECGCPWMVAKAENGQWSCPWHWPVVQTGLFA